MITMFSRVLTGHVYTAVPIFQIQLLLSSFPLRAYMCNIMCQTGSEAIKFIMQGHCLSPSPLNFVGENKSLLQFNLKFWITLNSVPPPVPPYSTPMVWCEDCENRCYKFNCMIWFALCHIQHQEVVVNQYQLSHLLFFQAYTPPPLQLGVLSWWLFTYPQTW